MPQAPTGKPARLSGVQALRGIAASAVVLCHAARHVDKAFSAPKLIALFQAGHAGVDLFFVISGFIILFVHGDDIGRPHRLPHYLGRRFNRVMPLYWLALAITIAMHAAGSHTLPPFGRLLLSASLLPSATEPLLGIAWTLQYELVFYAAFALLILNRAAGLLACLAWSIAIALQSAALPPPLTGAYGLEFFLGMAAAFLIRHQPLRTAPILATGIATLGAILFAAALALESTGRLNGFGTEARAAYGFSALLLVAGVAAADRLGHLAVPTWLQALGEASYSIYLFQFVFIGLAWQLWLHSGLAQPATTLPCFLALAAAAIFGGLLVSRLIEHPLLRLTRRDPALAAISVQPP